MNPIQQHYSPRWVAEYLGITRRTVYAMIADGRLVAVKLGKRTIRIPESEVRKFTPEVQ